MSVLLLAAGLTGVAAVAASPRPDDLDGWRDIPWGATGTEIASRLGPAARRLPARWQYGGAYAELMLPEVEIGGVTFRALFQMNEASDRLQQVLLERRRVGATPAGFERVVAVLERRLGPPDALCATAGAEGGATSLELRWTFPTTTVHLTFLDFQTTGVFSRDPNRDIDPLVPFLDVRRNLHRFMPRRILLRYHPAARDDLVPAGTCRSPAGPAGGP